MKRILNLIIAASIVFGLINVPVIPVAGKTLDDYADEVYFIDADDKNTITAAGLTAVTSPTNGNTYSGEWKFSKKSSLNFDITDISAYETIEFYLYGDKNHPSSLVFTIWAENSETQGSDYYNGGTFQVLDGWNKYTYSISQLKEKWCRVPRRLNNIDGIKIHATGWDTANDQDNTVLYVGDFKLIKGDVLFDDGEIRVDLSDVPAYKQVKSNAVSDVSNALCLKVNSPFALVYHEQKRIDESNENVTPVLLDGEVFAPVDFLKTHLGEGAVSGLEKTVYNGTQMVLVKSAAENAGKKFFYDDMGLVIVSDTALNYTKENDLSKMLDIMSGFIYERPGREKIKEDILNATPNHPRLLATAEDFERIKGYMETDSNIQSWTARIISLANNYVKSAPNEAEHTYSSDVGGRLTNSWKVQDKATVLGMAYQLTGDKKYPEAMWYTLEDMCDRKKWQHWHPGHFLNAADVMWGVAIAYDWMYDAWSYSQRTTIEKALYDCGVEDSITAYYGASNYLSPPMSKWHRSGWWAQGNNWNAVCNSGVVAAGVALATHTDYGNLAIKAIDFALNGFEIGLRCYAPDGGYEEGPGYWSYGTNHAIMLMAAIKTAAGSNYGLSDAPGFSLTYATPLYSESRQGMFNYSDTSATRTDTSSLLWFGKEYGSADVNGLRVNEITGKEKSASYKDILWYDPENTNTKASLELDYTFFETDTFTMRSSWTDTNQIFTGLHGGSNTANHCNIDSGTFVLDALGTRWFIDLGSDNYNLPNYWSTGTGGKRWQYYTQRAEGHNTFVINPGLAEDQVIQSVSPVTELVSKPRGAYGKVNLTPAYSKDVTKAVRGNMLTSNRRAVIIQDEITMKAPSEFYWFAHTKANIEVASDGRSAVLTKDSKQLKATIVSENEDFKFDVMDAVSLPTSPVPELGTQKENSRSGVRKLVIHAGDVSEVKLAVVFQPVIEGEYMYDYTYTNLDNWSIPDGEFVKPKLTGISVDSKPIKNFDSYETEYTVVLPYGTDYVPTVAADADELSDYEVRLPESLPGTAYIKVKDKTDDTVFCTYTLYLRVANEVEIEASDAQDGNPPENCLDKNLETRWAVEGEHWGIFRFAKPKTVSSVWVAAWKSAERKLIFDIEVSNDGENFTKVWSGKTTSNTDELEEFKIPRGTYKAIKLVLHGTTTVLWNSLLEVEFTNDAPEGTVVVNIDTEGGESISVNGENKGEITAEQVYTGSVLELVANGSGEFMYWIDADSKMILSTDKVYRHTVGAARNIKAVYAPVEESVITFTSMTKWLKTGASGLTTPKNPYAYGYLFNGWYVNGEKTELKEDSEVNVDSDVTVKAGFVKDRAKYIVTVDGVMKSRAYNEKMTVSAPASKEGKAFSYWKRDGQIVSYDKGYSFYVTGKTALESVYGESIKKTSVLAMTNPAKAEGNKIAFFAELDIVSDLEVVESGIIMGKNAGLTVENAWSKVASKEAKNKAQLTLRKANARAGSTYYAAAYAVCRNESGNIITLYSNEVSYTL